LTAMQCDPMTDGEPRQENRGKNWTRKSDGSICLFINVLCLAASSLAMSSSLHRCLVVLVAIGSPQVGGGRAVPGCMLHDRRQLERLVVVDRSAGKGRFSRLCPGKSRSAVNDSANLPRYPAFGKDRGEQRAWSVIRTECRRPTPIASATTSGMARLCRDRRPNTFVVAELC
jgi:hypothetical protein